MFLFSLTNSIKIMLLVILSIWTNVIFFWKRRDNMMLTLFTRVKRIYIYIFTWKGKRVAMRQIPPTPTSTQENASSFVSQCNQFDRNSRASSFEEGRTDVRRQSQKIRLNRRSNTGLGRLPGWSIKSAEDIGLPPGRSTYNREGNREETKSPGRLPVDRSEGRPRTEI